MSTTPETKNAPVHKERIGAVEAAVWKNAVGTEGKSRLGVTLTKSYKDREGNWQRTSALDVQDLEPAAQALTRCSVWVAAQRQDLAKMVAEASPLEEAIDEGQREQKEQRTVSRGR